MASFQDKWSAPQKQGFMDKLGDTFKPKGALKPRVEQAVKRLQAQIGKLDAMTQKLQERDQKIFQKLSLLNKHMTPIPVKYYQTN